MNTQIYEDIDKLYTYICIYIHTHANEHVYM